MPEKVRKPPPDQDPNYLAYQAAAAGEAFKDLTPGTFVAFVAGNFAASGATEAAAIMDAFVKTGSLAIFIAQPGVEKPVLDLRTPGEVRPAE